MNSENDIRYDEEIDLVKVIVRFGQFIRRQFFRLTVYLLIGVGLGLVWSIVQPATYTNAFLVNLGVLSKPHFQAIMASIDLLIKEKKDQSDKLNLTAEEVENILYVKALKASDDDDNQLFFVESKVYDPTIWVKLQTSIIDYIRRNSYVEKSITIHTKLYDEILKRVDSRIKALQYTRDMLFAMSDKDRQNLDIDLFPLYSELSDLEGRREDILGKISAIYDIEMVEEFTDHKSSDIVQQGYFLLIGGLIGLFAGLIIPLLRSPTKSSAS